MKTHNTQPIADIMDKSISDLEALRPTITDDIPDSMLGRINKHLRANVTFEGNHYLMRAYIGECMMFAINENSKGLLSVCLDGENYEQITRAELMEFPNWKKECDK